MDNIITELGEVLKGLNGALFDNKNKEPDNTLGTVNGIKHESFNIKYNTKFDNEGTPNSNDEQQKASKQNGEFIINEINNTRPVFSNKNDRFWLLIVLIALLFVQVFLYGVYCYKHRNDQEQKETLTRVEVVYKAPESVKDIIDVCLENCTDKCIQDTCVCPDKNGCYVIKIRQKKPCNRVIVLGIIAAILTIAILYIIVIYIGFLRKKQENDSATQNALVEFNKRMYTELVHLKTAETVFNKQLADQDLEMYKRAELIRFDEIQKYYDHKRKCEVKEYELKEKYLNKVVEIVNKNLEIQKEEKVYKELKIDAEENVRLDSINFNKI